jgi:hypothetical protein
MDPNFKETRRDLEREAAFALIPAIGRSFKHIDGPIKIGKW